MSPDTFQWVAMTLGVLGVVLCLLGMWLDYRRRRGVYRALSRNEWRGLARGDRMIKDPVIKRNMTEWNGSAGDRLDPVAVALRRFHLRVELCPCQHMGLGRPCRQCTLDLESIEAAWIASAPPKPSPEGLV